MEPYFFTEMWFSLYVPTFKTEKKLIQYLIHSYKGNKLAIQALFIYLMFPYPIAKNIAVALGGHQLGEKEKVSSMLIRHSLDTTTTLQPIVCFFDLGCLDKIFNLKV